MTQVLVNLKFTNNFLDTGWQIDHLPVTYKEKSP